MNLYRGAILALLAMAVAACSEEPAPQRADTDSAVEVANRITRDIASGINAGDAGQISRLFTRDAVAMPAQQATIEGREAIEQFYREFFTAYATTIDIVPVETRLFGDRGFSRGTYKMTLTPRTGEPPITDNGKYIYLIQRQPDGTWRLTHDMSNSSPP